MKRTLLLLAFASAACAGPGARRETGPDIRLTSEPSIERALDTMASIPEGRTLSNFLYKHQARFEYSNTPGFCHKFSLQDGKIFLPEAFRGSDILLTLALAKAAYIYRLYIESGIEDIIAEEEEAATLFQARVALEINMLNSDFTGNKFADEMKLEFCTYILDGARYAAQRARATALSSDPDCQRPLETLATQRIWLDRLRESINEDAFFQLLHERDQRRVRLGLLSQSQAMKNDAVIRALPPEAIYRFQRDYYDTQADIYARFEKAYQRALRDDESWHADNADTLQRAREEFSACNMPDLK